MSPWWFSCFIVPLCFVCNEHLGFINIPDDPVWKILKTSYEMEGEVSRSGDNEPDKVSVEQL